MKMINLFRVLVNGIEDDVAAAAAAAGLVVLLLQVFFAQYDKWRCLKSDGRSPFPIPISLSSCGQCFFADLSTASNYASGEIGLSRKQDERRSVRTPVVLKRGGGMKG